MSGSTGGAPKAEVKRAAAELEAQGELLLRAGRTDEALAHLRRALEAWRTVLESEPADTEAHQNAAIILQFLGDGGAAVEHVRALGQSVTAGGKTAAILVRDEGLFFEQDGKLRRSGYAYFRGEHTNFYPKDESLDGPGALSTYFTHGLTPSSPPLAKDSRIVAFGSCFAAHISDYLDRRGFDVATKNESAAYVSRMGDGIVNTYAIRQQFEWAWLGRQPTVELWHGYDAKALGYDEAARLATKELFDGADAFIITLGLSEVWYDEPTGEVFWRAVPKRYYDPARHKFRVVRHAENLANIKAIHSLIRTCRPEATIVFTLSPIPLNATFRPMSCAVSDSASKALLRSALDEFFWDHAQDQKVFYFPSYEIALRVFAHPYEDDRRHPRKHVLDLNMAAFERYFCQTGLTDEDLDERYRVARCSDVQVGLLGRP